MACAPVVRLGYALNAEAVRARRVREKLQLDGRRIEPDELLALLLAEGVPEDEAQSRATEHAAALMRADQAAREE